MTKSILEPETNAVEVHTMQPASRSRVGLYLAFMALVVAGAVLGLAGQTLIGGLGSTGTFGLILAGPFFLVAVGVGIWKSFGKFRALWKQLTWWHGLWLVMVVSNFVFRTRSIETVQQHPLDVAAAFRIFLVGLTAFLLMVRLTLKRPPWLHSLFHGLIGIMAVFALLCITSSLWSVNPPWTLYKSLEYLVDLSLLAAILASVDSTESVATLLNWTWVICGVLVAVAWLEAPIWPQEALEGAGGYVGGPLRFRLSGVYPGQGFNMLGTYGAILATIAICRLLPAAAHKFDRTWYAIVLMLGAVTMIFSQTRSAIVGFVVGVVLLFIITKRFRFAAGLGIASAAVLAFTGAGTVVLSFLQRGQSQTQIASLSGRLQWWGVAWDAFKLHPWTGYGAFTSGLAVFPRLGVKEVTPLHSDYVETLVGIGIWGPLLLLAALLGTWWILIRCIRRFPSRSLEHQLAVESIAVLGVLTARSVVMGVIMSQPPIQYFAILGFAEYLRRRYSAKALTIS